MSNTEEVKTITINKGSSLLSPFRCFGRGKKVKVFNKKKAFKEEGVATVFMSAATPESDTLSIAFAKTKKGNKKKNSVVLICVVDISNNRLLIVDGKDKTKILGQAIMTVTNKTKSLFPSDPKDDNKDDDDSDDSKETRIMFWASIDAPNYRMCFGVGTMEPKNELIHLDFNTSKSERVKFQQKYAKIAHYGILNPNLLSFNKVKHAFTNKTFHQMWQELGNMSLSGQGCISFKCQPKSPNETLYFGFHHDGTGTTDGRRQRPLLVCQVDKAGMIVMDKDNQILGKVDNKSLLFTKNLVAKTFWVSFHPKNYEIIFGYGSMVSKLKLLTIRFDESEKKKRKFKATYGIISKYSMWKPDSSVEDGKVLARYVTTPFTVDLPPLVNNGTHGRHKPLEALTDRSTYLDPSQLPEECKALHQNVMDVTLNMDFPDFADAVHHSCVTKGNLCNTLLRTKAMRMGDDNMTYLRITSGPVDGTAPGSPYVMEIWPPNCFSPVHDHANASAIIKVLHGSITLLLYSSTDPERDDDGNKVPFDKFRLFSGQVTWLTEHYYQTHQLYNPSDMVCITIQCYKYNQNDNVRYEYFDYVRPDGIHRFEPGSDMDLLEFKEKIQKEWDAYLNGEGAQPTPKKNDNAWA